MVWGTLLEDREEGAEHPLLGLQSSHVTESGRGLFVATSLFDDAYGPATSHSTIRARSSRWS